MGVGHFSNLSRSHLLGGTLQFEKLLLLLPQTECQRNVALHRLANMAEIIHTNLEHEHTLGFFTASVKQKSLPPFWGGLTKPAVLPGY